MAKFHDERVRMLDGDVEAESHQQHVLVADQLLRLLSVQLGAAVDGGARVRGILTFLQARLHHLDDVIEFARLLFDFSRQKEGSRGDRVPMKVGERVKTVEAMHVDDGRVYAQLSHLQALTHVLDEVGRLLALRQFFVGVDAASAARRVLQFLLREVPTFVALRHGWVKRFG